MTVVYSRITFQAKVSVLAENSISENANSTDTVRRSSTVTTFAFNIFDCHEMQVSFQEVGIHELAVGFGKFPFPIRIGEVNCLLL